jgi:hypothetical protein
MGETDRSQAVLHSGGHKGAEAEFGSCAEAWGLEEVTYSFPGHVMERSRGVVELTEAQLAQGDVSMEIVSRRMSRTYHRPGRIRRVIQSLFHIVNEAYHVFVVGWIQPDGTVKGGTGWAVELAKLFNRPVSVFDQDDERWHTWQDGRWLPSEPLIPGRPFAGTGTRNLTDAGRRAIADLFERSFGPA